jgi:uncharacterized protein YchJ
MMRFIHPVTPAEIRGSIGALRDELVPDGLPVYVDVTPSPDAPPNECFPIVEGQVRKAGGAIICGWTLWELPTVFVEAEFHAVWQSPEGALIDIVPKRWPTQRILFLPSPESTYQGHQVNNVRRPVSQDPAVVRFLATFDEEFEFMNRGTRAEQHGLVRLVGPELAEMTDILARREGLHSQVHSLHPFVGPYYPCICGSGKKAKWCHCGS